jgi:hypothetical protein
MRCYIAGPMRDIPYFNFPAFFALEDMLIDKGHEVFNPARREVEVLGVDITNPTGSEAQAEFEFGFSLRESMGADLSWIARNATAIVLLEGWEQSKGATAEVALGLTLGIRIYEQFGDRIIHIQPAIMAAHKIIGRDTL